MSSHVTTGQLILRGFTNRCPNCGGRTVFRGLIKMHDRCAHCGLRFEREDGFFFGAAVINYTVTAVLLLIPVLVLVFTQRVSVLQAMIFALLWCAIFPALFYRWSKSLWMMTYYLFVRQDLVAEQERATGSG